jgi:hypothetical protein
MAFPSASRSWIGSSLIWKLQFAVKPSSSYLPSGVALIRTRMHCSRPRDSPAHERHPRHKRSAGRQIALLPARVLLDPGLQHGDRDCPNKNLFKFQTSIE